MIKKANVSDSYNIAKLQVSGWQSAYKGLIDDNFLNNMSIDISCDNWKQNILSQNDDNHIYVYEKDNKTLGLIRFGKPDDALSQYNAEIHVLYVEPSLKRTGIGTKLFNFAKEYFINKNTTHLIIWCLKSNTPSIKFYQKMGGNIVSTRIINFNNLELEEVGIEYNLSLEFRPYIADDANTIIKWINSEKDLRLWSADRYGSYPISPDDINENYNQYISNKNFFPMSLVDNGKIVGHIILRYPDENNLDIVRLGFIIVDPSLRSKGYGKLLINKAIEFAKQTLNAKEINLGVFSINESAFQCYKSVGFREISIEQNAFQFEEERWDCIEMIYKDII